MSPTVHESAHLHVTGGARYTDDEAFPTDILHAWVLPSPVARGRITRKDASRARELPGVVAILFADDVPGKNLIGPIIRDEPLLAEDAVSYMGQAVALVLAEDLDSARLACQAIQLEFEEHPPITTLPAAIAAGSFHGDPHVIAKGDVEQALDAAHTVVHGTVRNGGQDHFYLEAQSALATPGEDGTLHILSSTQHPTEIQRTAASVLGIGAHRITSEVRRLGGGFGGKESQATPFATLAALGAWTTGRAVRLFLNRDQDMQQTGKRHPFLSDYRAGFDQAGQLVALDVRMFSDGGWSHDLSAAVLDRAVFHLDNAYFVPSLRFEGRVCRTNLPSNTAFRGFGGPQGILVVEQAINHYAEVTGRDPSDVRSLSFYRSGGRDIAPYGQAVPEPRLDRIWEELSDSCEYVSRSQAIARFNASSPYLKRGIGMQPVKFGISFTKALLNQAGAMVLVYSDGTVQLNHGGTEMGQGLYTKMIAVACRALGVSPDHVRQMPTSTEKVPNTSPTAASSGSDLNGQAVAAACATLRERLAEVAARMLGEGAVPATLSFRDDTIRAPDGRAVAFAAVANQAWVERVSLSATGFYATPGVAYDHATGRGTPFFYFAYGAAVSEVEVNLLTGEHRLLRVDMLQDVGDSLAPAIDIGQIEGAFVQGWGWLTCEEVIYGSDGRLHTHSPSTYKIPAVGDVPLDLRVGLLDNATQATVIYGSKAVGEPPFMLAISTVTAIRQAIRGLGPPGSAVSLEVPCTPESVLRAVVELQGKEEA